jgi:hypothetical protein
MDCGALPKVSGEMSGSEGGRAGGTGRASRNNQTGDAILDQNGDTKWRRILRLMAGGIALTRFDAERYGDHALNSTIAVIGSMGVRISRESITLAGRFGTIHCKRYWIEAADRDFARAILREAI